VVHQVSSDRGEVASHLRHRELRTDAVGGGHQDRIDEPAEVGAEQRTEAADLGQDARREGAPGELLDLLQTLILSFDVDTGDRLGAAFLLSHRRTRS